MQGHPNTVDDFWSNVDRTGGPDSCWNWTAGVGDNGYGTFGLASVTPEGKVHRIAYLLVVGPIPGGLQLDHLCRNRACCNPRHLEPVTSQTNNRRGLRRKLSEDDVRQIRDLYARGQKQRDIASSFGVSQMTVSRVVRRAQWDDVT